MEYEWAMEKRLHIHYEMSLSYVIDRIKTLKGDDRNALIEEWFEVLARDWEEEDIDYMRYWNDWSCFQ